MRRRFSISVAWRHDAMPLYRYGAIALRGAVQPLPRGPPPDRQRGTPAQDIAAGFLSRFQRRPPEGTAGTCPTPIRGFGNTPTVFGPFGWRRDAPRTRLALLRSPSSTPIREFGNGRGPLRPFRRVMTLCRHSAMTRWGVPTFHLISAGSTLFENTHCGFRPLFFVRA